MTQGPPATDAGQVLTPEDISQLTAEAASFLRELDLIVT